MKASKEIMFSATAAGPKGKCTEFTAISVFHYIWLRAYEK